MLTTARGGVLTVGAIFAIYFASSGVESLRIGLNRAYGLSDPRPWWLLRLESIGYVLVAAVGLLALSFLVVLGPLVFRTALVYMPWLAEVESHFNIGRFVVATILLVTSLLILHMWLPAGRRQFVEVWPGIVATLAMWLTCGFVFGRYLSNFSYTYVTYYAGLASAMMALVFLYFIALIFIYGGELNAAIARERSKPACRTRRLPKACAVGTALSPAGEGEPTAAGRLRLQAAVSATAPPVSVLTLRAWSTASRADLLWVKSSSVEVSSSLTGCIAWSL